MCAQFRDVGVGSLGAATRIRHGEVILLTSAASAPLLPGTRGTENAYPSGVVTPILTLGVGSGLWQLCANSRWFAARKRHATYQFHDCQFLPLIVTHGWPGSIIEQLKIVEPLTNPTAHGGSASDAFHLVIPSMPG